MWGSDLMMKLIAPPPYSSIGGACWRGCTPSYMYIRKRARVGPIGVYSMRRMRGADVAARRMESATRLCTIDVFFCGGMSFLEFSPSSRPPFSAPSGNQPPIALTVAIACVPSSSYTSDIRVGARARAQSTPHPRVMEKGGFDLRAL